MDAGALNATSTLTFTASGGLQPLSVRASSTRFSSSYSARYCSVPRLRITRFHANLSNSSSALCRKQKYLQEWMLRASGVLPSAEDIAQEDDSSSSDLEPMTKQKIRRIVNHPKKQCLILKFVWLENCLGLGIDQVLPGYGAIPVTPYYFWPEKNAWDELKAVIDSKPWISRKHMIVLLNQATDIINLWQERNTSKD